MVKKTRVSAANTAFFLPFRAGRGKRRGFFSARRAVFAAFLAAFAFSLFQINGVAKAGWLAEEKERQAARLSLENEALKSSLYRAGSLSAAEEKAKELGYERAGKIHYIEAPAGQAVVKR